MFQGADIASIVVGFLSLVGVLYTAWITTWSKRDTGQINKSVNHIRPGEKRLYELAVEASLQLNQLCSRMHGMEDKLDRHISEDRRCTLLENCTALSEQQI
jgi:hypothetical protein